MIDNAVSARDLAARWGYHLRAGEFSLNRGYDQTSACAETSGRVILEPSLGDPQPLRPADAYFVAHMHVANTPSGQGACRWTRITIPSARSEGAR
jgi:hypothetical protein